MYAELKCCLRFKISASREVVAFRPVLGCIHIFYKYAGSLPLEIYKNIQIWIFAILFTLLVIEQS